MKQPARAVSFFRKSVYHSSMMQHAKRNSSELWPALRSLQGMACIPLIIFAALLPIESFVGRLLRNGALHEYLGKVARDAATNTGMQSLWDTIALVAITVSNLVLFLLFTRFFSSLISENIAIGAHSKGEYRILAGICLGLAFGLPPVSMFFGYKLLILLAGGGLLAAAAAVVFAAVSFSAKLMEDRNA